MQHQRTTAVIIALSAILTAIIAGFVLAFNANLNTKPEPSARLLHVVEGYDLDQLFSYKTPYVGDLSNVVSIVQLLPAPDSSVIFDRLSLQTVQEPYGIDIYYVPALDTTIHMKDEYEKHDSGYSLRRDKNVIVLFSLIENLKYITLHTNYSPSGNEHETVTVLRSSYEHWLSHDLWADNYQKLIEVFDVIDSYRHFIR